MSGELDALVLDLVEWVAREPRSYADLFDAWPQAVAAVQS